MNRDGRGPAWSNSLFEDNAEFGLGMRLALDSLMEQSVGLLNGPLAGRLPQQLVSALLEADQSSEAGVAAQRERVVALRDALRSLPGPEAARLALLADHLVKKNVWIVGGDGWAYDIGFGGLDHVLSMRRDVNVLVLDTEVYSNTGGQQSKATPLGAAAKFAVAGKETGKKDLGLMAMGYGHVYVAQVAFGAKDTQTVKAFLEAESYPGPSLIIAYSHCIAHGYDMAHGLDQQRLAVDAAVWPLFRFDPRRVAQGLPPPRARLRAAQGVGPGVHEQRDALPHGGEDGPASVPAPAGHGRDARRPALRDLPAARRGQGARERGNAGHRFLGREPWTFPPPTSG